MVLIDDFKTQIKSKASIDKIEDIDSQLGRLEELINIQMEKLDNGFKRNNEEFTSKTSHLNGVIADLNSRVKSLEEEVLDGGDLERDPTGSGLNTRTS